MKEVKILSYVDYTLITEELEKVNMIYIFELVMLMLQMITQFYFTMKDVSTYRAYIHIHRILFNESLNPLM